LTVAQYCERTVRTLGALNRALFSMSRCASIGVRRSFEHPAANHPIATTKT
jgi:hypothetical protein